LKRSGDGWKEVSDGAARDKVSHALNFVARKTNTVSTISRSISSSSSNSKEQASSSTAANHRSTGHCPTVGADSNSTPENAQAICCAHCQKDREMLLEDFYELPGHVGRRISVVSERRLRNSSIASTTTLDQLCHSIFAVDDEPEFASLRSEDFFSLLNEELVHDDEWEAVVKMVSV
jgi:hypothetical protein